jgi:CoA transferase family III
MMSALPLSGLQVTAADWPAAAIAGRLLAGLGATVTPTANRGGAALRAGGSVVTSAATSAEQDWRASGASDLTGRADGPELAPTGKPASLARAGGLALRLLTGREIETTGVLGARAPLLGFSRAGAISVGGATRLLRAADGWIALNLARADDRDLVGALVEEPVVVDPWQTVAQWASTRSSQGIVDRAAMLGLAAAELPMAHRSRAAELSTPWVTTATPINSGRRVDHQLRVVNLGSLWAAPLCAHLLHLSGMQVTDVESTTRPDLSPPQFYATLHSGHRRVRLDFDTDDGRAQLGQLVRTADVVIEASRPRALRELGIPAESIMADGRPRVWVRITGHGQHQNRIAFGDDAAVAGGLVAWDELGPVFAGDAIADPLTGVLAALAAKACADAGGAWTVDLALSDVARYAASL